MKRSTLVTIFRWVILIAVLVVLYLPLVLIVVYSFSGAHNAGDSFGEFTFLLYKKFVNNDTLIAATKNTLIIGVVSALFATVLGTTAAVGIHYMRRRWQAAVDTASQITVVNAEIVTAMAFFVLMVFLRDTVRIPINFGLGWLIVAHTVITTPYVILTVSPRLKQLNPNLLEASMDLGASAIRSLITVLLPQLAGAMVSGFALAFTLSLDDFVVTNINAQGSGVQTLSTYVYANIKRGIPREIRAVSTILFVVVMTVLIVYNVIKNKRAKDQAKKPH